MVSDALVIRRAVTSDAAALNALMHGSSAYGGAYASILENYAISAKQIEQDRMFLALADDRVMDFYSLTLGEAPELDLMFVADNAQGLGVGRRLFDHLHGEAAEHGIAAIRIVSHPPALGFYERQGAVRIGTAPPSPTARWERPILQLTVRDTI